MAMVCKGDAGVISQPQRCLKEYNPQSSEISTSPKRKKGASSTVATGGTARGSRLTASRVLEWDDDKSDEPIDHEVQNGAASKIATGGKARGSKDANDSDSSPPFGGGSGSE